MAVIGLREVSVYMVQASEIVMGGRRDALRARLDLDSEAAHFGIGEPPSRAVSAHRGVVVAVHDVPVCFVSGDHEVELAAMDFAPDAFHNAAEAVARCRQ